MQKRYFRCLALIAAFFVTTHAAAVDPNLANDWSRKLKQSASWLKAGDHARAARLSEGVSSEMFELLGPGKAATEAFGIALVHRALAYAGLGRNDDALWYWHVVLGLYPKFAGSNLTMFGRAGKFLTSNPLTNASSVAEPNNEGAVTPPKITRRVEPQYPYGAQRFQAEGPVIIEVTLTADGRVTSPRVDRALDAPTLTFAALEALRKWKFEPARRSGRPIDSAYVLTVNFQRD